MKEIIECLRQYVKAQCNMLNDWSETNDSDRKKEMWQRLHNCESPAMGALEKYDKMTTEQKVHELLND